MENKNNKILIFVIIVLSILILGLSGYFVYEKLTVKSSNEEVNEQTEVDLILIEDLLNKYGKFHTELTNDTKMFIAVRNFDSTLVYLSNCDELYANEYEKSYDEYFVKLDVSNGRLNSGSCYESAKTYDYYSLNNLYKELFGTEIPKEDVIYFNGVSYNIYDYVDDKFVELNFNGGGAILSTNIVVVKDAKIENEKLVVNLASIDLNPQTDESFDMNFENYVVSTDETIIYTKEEVENSRNEVEKDLLENHYDVMYKYKYIFEKHDGHYILIDIQK